MSSFLWFPKLDVNFLLTNSQWLGIGKDKSLPSLFTFQGNFWGHNHLLTAFRVPANFLSPEEREIKVSKFYSLRVKASREPHCTAFNSRKNEIIEFYFDVRSFGQWNFIAHSSAFHQKIRCWTTTFRYFLPSFKFTQILQQNIQWYSYSERYDNIWQMSIMFSSCNTANLLFRKHTITYIMHATSKLSAAVHSNFYCQCMTCMDKYTWNYGICKFLATELMGDILIYARISKHLNFLISHREVLSKKVQMYNIFQSLKIVSSIERYNETKKRRIHCASTQIQQTQMQQMLNKSRLKFANGRLIYTGCKFYHKSVGSYLMNGLTGFERFHLLLAKFHNFTFPCFVYCSTWKFDVERFKMETVTLQLKASFLFLYAVTQFLMSPIVCSFLLICLKIHSLW